MRQVVRFLFVFNAISCLVGCSQANTANGHLASMDVASNQISDSSQQLLEEAQKDRAQLKRIADSISSFEDIAKRFSAQIETLIAQLFAAKPPAKTPDIDQILGPIHPAGSV